MSVEALEKRVGKCEDQIDKLSEKVTENNTNMTHFLKVVDKFEKFTDQCTKTLIGIENRINNLNEKHTSLEKKLCEVEDKVDNNEKLNTIDLREIQKKNAKAVFEKIFIILSPIALIAFILYMIFGK